MKNTNSCSPHGELPVIYLMIECDQEYLLMVINHHEDRISTGRKEGTKERKREQVNQRNILVNYCIKLATAMFT